MRLRSGNPMTNALAVLLLFEAVVFALAIPGMIAVSGVPTATASGIGGAAVVLALVSAATVRRGPGFYLGWLTQLAALALGFGTPYMFAVGVVFVLLWIVTFVLGKRLDASR